MAAKKKTQKKRTKSNRTAGRKTTSKKRLSNKKAIVRKKSAKKKPARRKAAVKAKAVVKKARSAKTVRATTRPALGRSADAYTVAISRKKPRASSGGQSGDLQGLSGVGRADSESVDELLEEGNAFEADAVRGVEEAGNAEEKEVRTHEVLEDDVPDEYLDSDK